MVYPTLRETIWPFLTVNVTKTDSSNFSFSHDLESPFLHHNIKSSHILLGTFLLDKHKVGSNCVVEGEQYIVFQVFYRFNRFTVATYSDEPMIFGVWIFVLLDNTERIKIIVLPNSEHTFFQQHLRHFDVRKVLPLQQHRKKKICIFKLFSNKSRYMQLFKGDIT